MKDEVADEVPVAYVVRSEGSQLTEDDVKSYVNKQVKILLSLSKRKTHKDGYFYMS